MIDPNAIETWTDWMHREQGRMLQGTYQPVPVILEYPVKHFVHLSVTETEADYVAYTPSDAYGEADRQIRLKFGRYLKKTFQDMTDAEIQKHVTSFKSTLATQVKPAQLHFATDVEVINRIFETQMQACGSCQTSCMYGKFDDDEIRPYHVYANSPDVAVAYVMTGDEIVSRSVVSTKDKLWVRAYSISCGDNDTDCGTLKRLLEDAGYSKGDLDGCRLTKLDTGSVMLPYIDGDTQKVRDDGKYWVVTDDDADYEADCTDGTATEIGNHCSSCDERENECECDTCECCGDRSRYGCDDCSMCEECDGCRTHDGCSCTRCSDCHEIINPRHRYIDRCECTRCGDCNELEDECECEHCGECNELEENCSCTRCDECNELEENCECEHCDTCTLLKQNCGCESESADDEDVTGVTA